MNNQTTAGDIPQQYNKLKNECKHNFFPIKQDVDNDVSFRPVHNSAHVVIGCCWCGQVRKLYATGLVSVIIHKGTIKYEV